MVPLRGYSMLNRQGQVLYDEAANLAFARAMEEALAPDVPLVQIDAHINDPEFAAAVVDQFLEMGNWS
jgi:uncharacterized protein (UPF0261 family)